MLRALIKRIPPRLFELEVAVIMGGPSPEREVSLMSGNRVAEALRQLQFKVLPLEYNDNLARELMERNISIAFLATHGAPGEDGTLQGLLEALHIQYTGSSVAGSALAMNKIASKALLAHEGILTPDYRLIDRHVSREELVHQLAREIGFPMVIKPVFGGSSLGIRLVQSLMELRTALELLMPEYADLFAEKYISGRELTASILEDSTGRPATLPILELEPRHLFYDYECKVVAGKTDFLVPAALDPVVQARVDSWSKLIHEKLGLRDFSRSDFMLGEKGELYYLETNSIPGLTHLSDLPAQAKAHGLTFEEVVVTILLRSYSRMLDAGRKTRD